MAKELEAKTKANRVVINTTARSKELKSAKEQMRQGWLKNREVSPAKLARQFGVKERTAFSWVYKWRREEEQPHQELKHLLSWENIVKTAPDTAVLSSMLFDGFMAKLAEQAEEIERLKVEAARIPELEDKIKAMTNDRTEVFRQYNELLVKMKSGGHFTIDKVQRILIPKERE